MKISFHTSIPFFIFLVLCGHFTGYAQSKAAVQQKMAALLRDSHTPALVCAHRGDWRNAPENSMQALQNCIAMGVDIMELDLKKTKDGHLIIMHDNTIERTVKAKGKPEDYTLAEIRKFRLRNGTGHATSHHIPTFEEMMIAAKDKIIIDIDKGYVYFDEVIAILQKTGTLHQVIFNITKNLPFDSVKAAHPVIPEGLVLMPVVDVDYAQAAAVVNSYKGYPQTVIQLDFESDQSPLLREIPALKKAHVGIWFNSIWPESCGGHCDDVAVEEGKTDECWGWLQQKGASVIQTDRPAAMVKYLHK
jgi:glycerophosphoryl diester phosphodiesterase